MRLSPPTFPEIRCTPRANGPRPPTAGPGFSSSGRPLLPFPPLWRLPLLCLPRKNSPMRCCAGSLPSPSPQWTPVAPPCRAATQHHRGSQPFKGRRLSRAGPGWGQQICVPSSSHTPLPSRSRAAGILSVGSSATARRLSARWHGPSVRTQGPQVEWGRGAAGKTAGASLLK